MTTNYTPAQRQAIARVFKAAKQFLWNGRGCRTKDKRYFICYAIGKVDDTGMSRGCRDALYEISRRLGHHATATQYLRYGLGVPEHELTDKAVQSWRHAWLDALIAEFSA